MTTPYTNISDITGVFSANLVSKTQLEVNYNGEGLCIIVGEDLEDTWNTIMVDEKPYDVHVHFSDNSLGYDDWAENRCTFEIFGLEKLDDGTIQVDTSTEISIPINFVCDQVAVYNEVFSENMKRCSECEKVVTETEGRPYKYEGSRWVCDTCHDALVDA
jgi:hypothetical protein